MDHTRFFPQISGVAWGLDWGSGDFSKWTVMDGGVVVGSFDTEEEAKTFAMSRRTKKPPPVKERGQVS